MCVYVYLYDMSHERVLRARESTSRVAGAALADGVLMFCGRVTRLSPSLDPKTLAISSFLNLARILYTRRTIHVHVRYRSDILQLETFNKTNYCEIRSVHYSIIIHSVYNKIYFDCVIIIILSFAYQRHIIAPPKHVTFYIHNRDRTSTINTEYYVPQTITQRHTYRMDFANGLRYMMYIKSSCKSRNDCCQITYLRILIYTTHVYI